MDTQQIAILPFHGADPRTLAGLVDDLARHGVHATLLPESEVPKSAFDPARCQYRADVLLTACTRAASSEPGLGVTAHDLYVAGLNFVFGLAQVPGHAAVIALARLNHGAAAGQLRARVLKEAMHELGHIRGLTHCTDPACVMHFSNSLQDTDRKGGEYCGACRARLVRTEVAVLED